jgi:hypothetical protein
VLIANTVSDDFTALGKHKWQAWITETADSTNKVLVGEGYTTVNPGFVASTVTAVDERSTAKIMLDTLDAAILAAGSSREDAAERSAAGKGFGTQVKVRFRGQ